MRVKRGYNAADSRRGDSFGMFCNIQNGGEELVPLECANESHWGVQLKASGGATESLQQAHGCQRQSHFLRH